MANNTHPDAVKAAHDQRKRAIQAEKEARMKRLENVDNEIALGIEAIGDVHNFLSMLEQESYSGKNKGNNDLSTSISLIAKALTHLNEFKRGKNGAK